MPVFCLDRKSTRLNSSHLVISYAGLLLGSEEHTSELQSPCNLVCRLLLEKIREADSFNTSANLKITTESVPLEYSSTWSSKYLNSGVIFFLMTRRQPNSPPFPTAASCR